MTITLICILMFIACSGTYILSKENEVKQLNSTITEVQKVNEKLEEEYQTLLDDTEVNVEVKHVLESLEETIDYASTAYGVDKILLIAIMRAETSNFTSDVWITKNNAGGMKGSGEYYSYPSPEAGVIEVARMLSLNYISKGMTTPELMASTYCPPNPEHWIELVRSIMSEYQS